MVVSCNDPKFVGGKTASGREQSTLNDPSSSVGGNVASPGEPIHHADTNYVISVSIPSFRPGNICFD